MSTIAVGEDGRVGVAKGVHARDFDGEVVLLDLERGEYFGLDEIGARVWAGLARGNTPREIARELAEDYEVDTTRLLADVLALLEQLLARGLVVVAR